MRLNKGFRLFNFSGDCSWISKILSDILFGRECDGFLQKVLSRWAQLVRVFSTTDSDIQISKNGLQLKLKLHQLWRTAMWLSHHSCSWILTTACFSGGNMSLWNFWKAYICNSLVTVLLFPLCDQARPWFRFSTRTSSVAGLAFFLVAATRATLVICSVLLFVLL